LKNKFLKRKSALKKNDGSNDRRLVLPPFTFTALVLRCAQRKLETRVEYGFWGVFLHWLHENWRKKCTLCQFSIQTMQKTSKQLRAFFKVFFFLI